MRNILIIACLFLLNLLTAQTSDIVVFIGSVPANSQMSVGYTVASRDMQGGVYNYRCDTIADQEQINAAIIAASEIPFGGDVYLTGGKFVINAAIKFYDNVRLILSPQTHIYLAGAADCYMGINEDTDNGNTGFQIIGGRWYGRALLQERHYPTSALQTPAQAFFGWGFAFNYCTNFILKDMYIEDTEAWAIAYFHSNNVKFLNNEITQLQPKGHNQDGITGNSNKNVLIDGLTVSCADDPIAMGCTTSHLGYLGAQNWILWGEGYDCENLTFRNIYCKKLNDSTYGFPAIGLYPAEGRTIRNVVIENVYGGVGFKNYGLVHILNAFTSFGKGYVDGLSINNVDIILDETGMNVLQLGAYSQTTAISNYLSVSNISVSNVIARGKAPGSMTLFNINSCMRNGSFNNIVAFDSANYKHNLMSIATDVDSIKINVGSVDPVNALNPVITDVYGGSNHGLRINAPYCKTNIARINAPKPGDRIIDIADDHPLIYLINAFVDLY